jgi:hypothetical protein
MFCTLRLNRLLPTPLILCPSELERVSAEVAQLQKASDERSARVLTLRDSIKSMESGSQEALSSASEHRKVAAELQGECVVAFAF